MCANVETPENPHCLFQLLVIVPWAMSRIKRDVLLAPISLKAPPSYFALEQFRRLHYGGGGRSDHARR